MAWKLFPITAGSKAPALVGDWRAHATDSVEQIDAWRAQGYDLAVDCGGSGLFVIDVDGEIGEATLRTLGPLSPTYTVRTPRGGRHLYYLGVGPNTVAGLGPKVDTRGPGGYVVWEGPGYEVIDGRAAVAVDRWVGPALSRLHKSRKAGLVDVEDLPANVARARVYLHAREPAVEGEGGNDHTYKTAATLRDLGLSEDKALALMVEEWNDRCVPPWEDNELAEVIGHAWDYAQNEAGAQALAGDPRTRFLGVDHGAVLQPERSRYHLWTVGEALRRPPPSWLFPGLLPAKAVGVVYGPKDVGKTWLVLDQALHLATGIAGYGRDVSDPQDVIYFTGEGFEDLVHSRVLAWCAHNDYDPEGLEHFRLLERFPNVANDADVDVLGQEIRQTGLSPTLLVLDTYARVLAEAGLNENDPLDVMKFVRQAEDLKRGFGCTILAVAHAGKDLERKARGASTLLDAADFVSEITADWSVKALKLECIHMKMARRFEPLHFEAIPQGESLAVRGITPDAYRVLTSGVDIFSSQAVGTALAALGARDDDSAVTAYVLAHKLYKAEPGEPEQETAAAVDRIARKLSQMAKGRLEQYVTRAGWRVLR